MVLAMASNAQASTAPDIRAALAPGRAGWRFEFVLSSADLGVTKPDPAFFAVVLRACGCAPRSPFTPDAEIRDLLDLEPAIRTLDGR